MTNLRDVFVRTLCGFTHLHSPAIMRGKNAMAFQYLLRAAWPENVGDHLEERCASCSLRLLLSLLLSWVEPGACLRPAPNDLSSAGLQPYWR